MSADWPIVTLNDVGVSLIDCDHKTPKAQDEGLPYVGIPQLKEGRITLESVRLITEEDFHSWRRKAKPTLYDVILSRRCNPGETAYVPVGLEIALGQNLVLLRADGDKLYPPFLRWVVQGTMWWNQVGKFINVGAVFDSLKCKDIPKFEIKLPPMESQKKIAEILGEIDDKIELNRKINQTLEQMAQAIFKSWFVDFEPVKAKIEAKANDQDPERAAMCTISGNTDDELYQIPPAQLVQLQATAALFPDELTDSKQGVIPKGWGVGSMKNCCVRVESGGTPKRSENSYWNGSIRWLSSGEVRNVIVLDTKEKITEDGLNNSSAKLWPPGSTVMAMYGATAGQVCLVAKEMTANQACCALIPKNYYQSYIFLSARRSIEDLSGKASGSAQQNLNKSLVSDHKALLPPEKTLESFEQITTPFLEGWIKNTEQSIVLSQLRDTLLPKLLSGEISVGDAWSSIKEAT